MPWWPYLMHPEPGYLYQMEVFLHGTDNVLLDVYRLRVGVRTLSWNNTSFMINNHPVYFRGFGRHEDSDVGCVRDINLVCTRLNFVFLADTWKGFGFSFNDS